MVTKLQAADLARRSGTKVVIAQGSETDILIRLAKGEDIGTQFLPLASVVEGRKRFLLAERTAKGKIKVDDGAVKALRQGSSLLPVGISQIEGHFERGDIVRILEPNGREVARGLTNYAFR